MIKCPGEMVAHPFAIDKLRGRDLRKAYPFMNNLCEGSKNPNGAWVEYQWPKRGETQPSRKIAFVLHVEGTPYAVLAGIYNDDISIEELNKTMK